MLDGGYKKLSGEH